MTKREAVIISAYTGEMICELHDYMIYASKLMGRKLFDFELTCPVIVAEIRRKAKKDFEKLEVV